MSFRENINRICIQRGTNLTAVVKQVKGSSSFTSAINKGSLPKEDEMDEWQRYCIAPSSISSWTERRPCAAE